MNHVGYGKTMRPLLHRLDCYLPVHIGINFQIESAGTAFDRGIVHVTIAHLIDSERIEHRAIAVIDLDAEITTEFTALA